MPHDTAPARSRSTQTISAAASPSTSRTRVRGSPIQPRRSSPAFRCRRLPRHLASHSRAPLPKRKAADSRSLAPAQERDSSSSWSLRPLPTTVPVRRSERRQPRHCRCSGWLSGPDKRASGSSTLTFATSPGWKPHPQGHRHDRSTRPAPATPHHPSRDPNPGLGHRMTTRHRQHGRPRSPSEPRPCRRRTTDPARTRLQVSLRDTCRWPVGPQREVHRHRTGRGQERRRPWCRWDRQLPGPGRLAGNTADSPARDGIEGQWRSTPTVATN